MKTNLEDNKIIESDKIVIRPFSENDSIEELTGLLHRAYKFLADMGLHFIATWQTEEMTERLVTNGDCFIAMLDDRMIGTILLYGRHKDDGTLPDWYKKDDVRVCGKFAVEPEYQRQGIGNELMDFIEEYAKKLGLKELALDTSDKAQHLIDYYTKRGYRFICTHKWPGVNYHSIVLSKKLFPEDLNNITIRPFSEKDSIKELTDLLHKSYKSLLDAGWRHVAGWQDEKMTAHHISTGECLIAEQNGKLIGTILLYGDFSDKGDVPDLYRRKDVKVFGKFAVDPEFQKSGVGGILLDFAENHAKEQGMKELALDTSEDTTHLIEFYKKRGYEIICNHQWKITNFRSVVMSKKL
ncbi:MAG: GNAT family N-acetyltransferase [Ignavibacteria bacterium]